MRWPKKNSTHCPGWVDHYSPRSATLYVDTHALPTHLFDNAKVRLRSAINILAMTRLLDEKEEPGGTLAYINGALLSLLSDALSEIEAGH
ncbi:hypothetical protein, partial [Pseudomonas aeruginosa]|uniref:hypothetical protein n=1 Tax=Pseudomonas aeruginosa TaxID=287 RepID=UPI00202996A4